MNRAVIGLTFCWILWAVWFVGCVKRPIHPGAVNTFDSTTYDALVTIQAAIEQASIEVAAHPNLKPELNKVIDGYNAAMKAYKAYHEAAVAGNLAGESALMSQVTALKAAVAAIVGKLKPLAPINPGPGLLIWGPA